MTQETKRCRFCGTIKFLTDFYEFTSRKDGSKHHDSYCKKCRSYANSKAYRNSQRERIDAIQSLKASVRENEKYCPRCKRVLPLSDFYIVKSTGKPVSFCKECSRERSRSYKCKSKAHNGVFVHKCDGRLRVFTGVKGGQKLYWTENMLSVLRRYYPNSPSFEVAEMIGVQRCSLDRKAKELGIKKSPEYIRRCRQKGGIAGGIAMRKKIRKLNQQNQP